MVELKECVRFKCIPDEFFDVCEVLKECAGVQGAVPTITGASYEDYPKGSYHDKGYAWDIRVEGIPEPLAYACCLRTQLKSISEKYRVVYGDVDHTDHIHIEFRYDKKNLSEDGG